MNAEEFILANHPDAVVVRPALFYEHSLNGRPSFTEVMLKKLHTGEKVPAFVDQFRTPVLVDNLAKALWELMEHKYCGLLHIGGSQKISRFAMGEILCEVFGFDKYLQTPMKTTDVPLPAKRPVDCSLDISLATKILKTPFIDYRAGLRSAFSSYYDSRLPPAWE